MEFIPPDKELVGVFLYNKIHNNPLPTHLNILEYDLYGNKNPWEIWEEFGGTHSYGGKDLYFFTTLKKKSPNGKRYLRTIGSGSWEGEDSPRFILTKDGNVLGMRKRFCFEKSDTPQDGGWYLHEYSLNISLTTSDHKFSSHVLCRFRKNTKYDKRNTGMEHSSQARQKRIERPPIPKPRNNVLSREDLFNDIRSQLPKYVDIVVETSTKTKAEHKEEEDCVEIIRKEQFMFTAQKRPIVLGLAATTEADNKNACFGKNIHQGSRKQPEGEDKAGVVSTRKQPDRGDNTDVVETSTKNIHQGSRKRLEGGDKAGVVSTRKQPDGGDKTDVVDTSTKIIHQGSRNQPEGGDKAGVVGTRKQPDGEDKIDVDETSTRKKAKYNKEEDDDDDDPFWFDFFANELIEANKDCLIEEEEVQMLPNPFAEDYLSEFKIEKHPIKINSI